MNISVVGTGYVGLVSGVCLAEIGHNVVCVDNDLTKVNLINSGKSPIYEVGLSELLSKHINDRLQATTDLPTAVMDSELTLIAVGTPFNGDDIDLRYIEQVTKEIGEVLKEKLEYHAVIVKSTVVPGTTDQVVLSLLESNSGKKAGIDFGVGMNPEFLREGSAIMDFMHPDRIVIGGIDEKTQKKLNEIYAPFTNVDKLMTNNKTAEMIKYTSNSLLATLISFSNEIGNLCATLGDIDVQEVMKGVHLDKRISPILENNQRISPTLISYLEAGCGFGGSCFPKDVKALISHGKNMGKKMQLLQAVVNINNEQPKELIRLLKENFNMQIIGCNVTVLGLSFKPKTDDIRESPAIKLITELINEKCNVKVFDPIAMKNFRNEFSDWPILYANDIEEAISDSDAIIVVTNWEEFDKLPILVNSIQKNPLIIDGRGMFKSEDFDFYTSIGSST
jgi:UDPglucose 6-dehydrogenase